MKTIGRYEIRGLLGRGGMSKVYKVRMPVTGKILALKRLDPHPHLLSLLGGERIKELFVSEAVNMANLRHPNVVEIWDFDTDHGKTPFYTMDYHFNNLGILMGETYRTEMPSRVIPVDKALEFTRQTLAALACLHHFGIIHRDVKPYNILLTEYDGVRLCDFGLSKLRGERFGGPENLKVGSPFYAAPEQEADPDDAEYTADLYSVGVMLYRMLTGTLPSEPRELPSRLNPELDWRWDAFIQKGMAKNIANRFPTATAMGAEMEKLAAARQKEREAVCKIFPVTPTPVPAGDGKPTRHRSNPLKVRPAEAQDVFALDELWRPESYIRNDFHPKREGIVADRATGLLWQQAGSEYPLTWEQAHGYIRAINQWRFGGRRDWRLPTVDELMSLLTEAPQRDTLCMDPVFDPRQRRLWSSDRRSFTAAWYVSVDMGFVWWQDFSGFFYIKGVCGLPPGRKR